jgi:hypothetical protein
LDSVHITANSSLGLVKVQRECEICSKRYEIRVDRSCQQPFEQLKQALITAPVPALSDFNRQFILTTDASTSGISYILSQKDSDGKERVINYGRRALHANETKWVSLN